MREFEVLIIILYPTQMQELVKKEQTTMETTARVKWFAFHSNRKWSLKYCKEVYI